MTFGAVPPAWSKDGWSFPPVALDDIQGSFPNKYRTQSAGHATFEVLFVSQGLRGRVECYVIENTDRWLRKLNNLTALTPYNNATTPGRPAIREGFEFSPEVRVVQLPNYTGTQPDTTAIGQWLHGTVL